MARFVHQISFGLNVDLALQYRGRLDDLKMGA